MQIKTSANRTGFLRNCMRLLHSPFGRRRSLRCLVLIPLVFIVIAGMMLGSVFFGVRLRTDHETLKQWILSVARHKLAFIPNYVEGRFAQPEHIDIDIKHKDFQKLAYKRQQALEAGFLHAVDEDWIPAKIRYHDETYKVMLRLKGDRSDHWAGADGWSYKVKIKDEDKTFLGMKRFALQAPVTRGYLNDWFMHKLFAHCGLISLRYDFIEVAINGKTQPIYAIEENFEKRLIEHNGRRDGPIVRFNTELLWRFRGRVPEQLTWPAITAYQMKRIEADEKLYDQFITAQNLLEHFRQNTLPPGKVFDSQKLAMFFAIIDLMGYHHAVLLDNVKFYYNPVTSLLEPVGYDNSWLYSLEEEGLWGAGRPIDAAHTPDSPHQDWGHALFRDRDFFKCYVRALEKLSGKAFLDDFFAGTDVEYREKLQVLHKDYPWYHFEGKSILYANQQYIRNALYPVKALHCYFRSYDADRKLLSLTVRNIHEMPTEVVGISLGDRRLVALSEARLLPPRTEAEPFNYQTVDFLLPDDFQWTVAALADLRVNYTIIGASRSAEESIYARPALDESFVQKDFIRQQANHETFDFLAVDKVNKTIVFAPGHINLDQNLIIPKGFTVYCLPGTNLDLSNSAKILSYSPVIFNGSAELPITVKSSDGTGQGIVVMCAQGQSELKHVIFDGLTYPAQATWQLTSSVTFYESPVNISHCRFSNNFSEDSLNLIRSQFVIDNCVFSSTSSDALDVDFCNGSVTSSSFLNIGNDAIDVSGSEVQVHDVFINKAGDKGLSVGENSVVTAERLTIKNAEIALASKDMSRITIDGIVLSDCRIGFAAYQKKSEFGPGALVVTNLQDDNVSRLYLIEARSSMILDAAEITPNADQQSVKDILYGVEYGKSSKILPL